MAREKAKKRIYGRVTVILTALILLVSLLTIPCYISQYEKNYETRKLNAQLEEEINYGKRLQIEYKKCINYKDVEDYVTENLNMKKIENYQIQYITKAKENMSVVVKNEEQDGFFSQVANTFSIIAEYFR